jgi:prolyl oligopeptidase
MIATKTASTVEITPSLSTRKRLFLDISQLLAIGTAAFVTAPLFAGQNSITYPQTRQTNQVDDYHGQKVQDPYRWLEDDNSKETKQWVEAQNKITFAFLEQIPERKSIQARLTRLWNYERYGIPFKEGGRYFLTKNDGLQNQSVLYTMDSLQETPRVLLDPNKLSADGTAALSGYAITQDGKRMAYGIASAGSDWQEWKVRDVGSGEDLGDEIKWVKFSSTAVTTRPGPGNSSRE